MIFLFVLTRGGVNISQPWHTNTASLSTDPLFLDSYKEALSIIGEASALAIL
jgi:hypothetical protein